MIKMSYSLCTYWWLYCFHSCKTAELADVQADQQREMEGLLDNVRQLTRDLRLQMLVIDAFIPPEYQVHIIDDKYFINVTVIITNISKVSCIINWIYVP